MWNTERVQRLAYENEHPDFSLSFFNLYTRFNTSGRCALHLRRVTMTLGSKGERLVCISRATCQCERSQAYSKFHLDLFSASCEWLLAGNVTDGTRAGRVPGGSYGRAAPGRKVGRAPLL